MRRLTVVLAIVFLTTSLPNAFASGNQEISRGPTTWTVLVGSEDKVEKTEHGMMGAWQNSKFYPSQLTIDEGDTVVFRFETTETHNAVFNPANQSPATDYLNENGDKTKRVKNPLALAAAGDGTYDGTQAASSGPLHGMEGMAAEWKLTFTKEGGYTYVCTPHSAVVPVMGAVGMKGRIQVQKAGAALPKNPEQVTLAARAEMEADIAADRAADEAAHAVAQRPGKAGTTIWTVFTGYSSKNGGEYLRFGADDLKIRVGDTVEWVQKGDNAPHTVSFFSGGDETPETLTVDGKIYENPKASIPVGGPEYDGTGVASSGMMPGAKTPVGGPRRWSLTFTKAGHFEYLCIPHDEMGMMAYITVE